MADLLDDITEFENILSEAEKQRLKDAQAKIPVLRRNIQKAKRAGIDTGDLEAQLDEAETKLDRLLREIT